MQILNITKNTEVAHSCNVANTFFSRFIGLLGKKELPKGSGLLLIKCNSIHMFFMKIALDVVFIDKNNTVVAIYEDFKPWKFTPVIKKAYSVMELPVGTIKESHTQVGDVLKYEEKN